MSAKAVITGALDANRVVVFSKASSALPLQRGREGGVRGRLACARTAAARARALRSCRRSRGHPCRPPRAQTYCPFCKKAKAALRTVLKPEQVRQPHVEGG